MSTARPALPRPALRRRALLAAAALVAIGCGGPASSTADGGDALTVTPAAYSDATHALTPLADGDPIDLVFPPQGGHVIFAGVEVAGLSPDDGVISLHGRLVDPASGATVGEETRTVELVADPTDATRLVSDARSYTGVSNVPVCPDPSPEDRVDRPYRLELTVTGLATGKRGVGVVRVVPSCRQTDASALALCRCECTAGWTSARCR